MPEISTTGKRLPGPAEPVSLAIEPATLATLNSARATYGNLVQFTDTRGRPAIFVNRPSLLRQILVRNHARYEKGPGFERVKMLLGNGIIVSDGATWRRHRRIMQPAFTRRAIERSVTMMQECAWRHARQWLARATTGETFSLTGDMSDYALDVIMRSIFSDDYERRIVQAGANPFAFLSKDSARDLRVVTQLRSLRALVQSIIDERRDGGGDYGDFLAALMTTTDKDGQSLDDSEVIDEVMTLVVAGYETSAGTLNWAWYLLATHPEIESRAVDEARRVVGSEENVSAATILELRYLRQVLDETLRLYPPVWLYTRKAVADDDYDDVTVSPESSILISPFIMQRSAEFWPDPDRFDPERFADVETSSDTVRAYCPFSLGPRRCIGEYFAFLEMQSHLAVMLQQFRIELASADAPALDLGINLRAAEPIMITAHKR